MNLTPFIMTLLVHKPCRTVVPAVLLALSIPFAQANDWHFGGATEFQLWGNLTVQSTSWNGAWSAFSVEYRATDDIARVVFDCSHTGGGFLYYGEYSCQATLNQPGNRKSFSSHKPGPYKIDLNYGSTTNKSALFGLYLKSALDLRFNGKH